MRVIVERNPLREGRQATPDATQKIEKGTQTALQASRRPYPEALPHQEPEVEHAAVKQHTFEDVVVAAKMRAPHTPGSVAVSEGALGSFSSSAMQTQPTLAALRPRLAYTASRLMISSRLLRRPRSGSECATQTSLRAAEEPACCGSPCPRRLPADPDRKLRSSCEHARSGSRPARASCSAWTCLLVRTLDRHRHDRARSHVHSLLGLVARCVRPSFIFVILSSGSAGLFHSWFEPFFFRSRSSRASACRDGVRIPDALARRFKNSWSSRQCPGALCFASPHSLLASSRLSRSSSP